MLYQTLKLIKLWQTLQIVDSLEKQFGDIKLSDCKKIIEEENDYLIDDINRLAKSIKNIKVNEEPEEDVVMEVLKSIFFKKR